MPCPSRSLGGGTIFGVLSVFRCLKIRGKWSQQHVVVGCSKGMEAMCIGNFMRSGSAQSGGRVVHLVVESRVDMPRWRCPSRVSEGLVSSQSPADNGSTPLKCSGHHHRQLHPRPGSMPKPRLIREARGWSKELRLRRAGQWAHAPNTQQTRRHELTSDGVASPDPDTRRTHLSRVCQPCVKMTCR